MDLFRIGYALKHAWLARGMLKKFLIDPRCSIGSLAEITPQRLDDAHIAILILDFDGVLGPHDADEPLPEVAQWLRALSGVIGEQRIAILSNKPKPARLRYFSTHFPSINFVYGVPKKPYPEGLLSIAEYRGVPPHRVALVDDRLLTGMLATYLGSTQAWYFRQPIQNFRQHFFKECFFSFLRGLERGMVRLLG